MKAAIVVEPGRLEVQDIQEPQITDYQAKCRTICCGICAGTDTRILNGKFHGFNSYPAVLGHETIGEVIEVGKKVECFKVGDKVLHSGLFHKLHLPEGLYSGFGGLAEYTVCADYEAMKRDNIGPLDVAFISMQKVPEWLKPIHGVTLILFKEVLSGMQRFKLKPNSDIAIFGAGPVGVTFVRLAKVFGLGRVVIVSRTKTKLDRAKYMGADLVINSQKIDPVKALRNFIPQGYDYIIDAVGSIDVIQAGLKLVKMNGVLCVYGVPDNFKMRLDWSTAPNNWTLQFHNVPIWQEESATHEQVCNLIRLGVLEPEKYVDTVMPFTEIHKVFELLWAGKAFKAVVEF